MTQPLWRKARRTAARGASLSALALGAWAQGTASADVKTLTLRYGPVSIDGFEVKSPEVRVPAPRRRGFLTRMSVELTDLRGRPVADHDVMLHHVVFLAKQRQATPRPCTRTNLEPFYGTGEEKQQLILPRGYGYPVHRRDRWRMHVMLMSHSLSARKVYVRYRVTIDTSRRVAPVFPMWVRAHGCEFSYSIEGGGLAGSADRRSADWIVPFDARIVAAGGHLHAGAIDMWVSDPECNDRRLLGSPPLYGPEGDHVYRAKPVLHEPGPVSTGYFRSGTGIPVSAGQRIRVNAAYDALHPRPLVMAIMHLYLARAQRPPACSPLPGDARTSWRRAAGRRSPPFTEVPLNKVDENGRIVTTPGPPDPEQTVDGSTVVDVAGNAFRPANLSVPAGATVTWRFEDVARHNVTIASGPRVVATPDFTRGQFASKAFDVPGTYRLFCTLHPLTMHHVIRVRGGAQS